MDQLVITSDMDNSLPTEHAKGKHVLSWGGQVSGCAASLQLITQVQYITPALNYIVMTATFGPLFVAILSKWFTKIETIFFGL